MEERVVIAYSAKIVYQGDPIHIFKSFLKSASPAGPYIGSEEHVPRVRSTVDLGIMFRASIAGIDNYGEAESQAHLFELIHVGKEAWNNLESIAARTCTPGEAEMLCYISIYAHYSPFYLTNGMMCITFPIPFN